VLGEYAHHVEGRVLRTSWHDQLPSQAPRFKKPHEFRPPDNVHKVFV